MAKEAVKHEIAAQLGEGIHVRCRRASHVITEFLKAKCPLVRVHLTLQQPRQNTEGRVVDIYPSRIIGGSVWV